MNSTIKHLIEVFETPFINPVLVFALILFIILISPILLRRLKIPGIIVLILSGVLVGPHALNLLEQSSAVDLFSTIGLLYIMFIAGLELDLIEFRKSRHKSIIFGIFTFIIPFSVGFPVCYYILGFDVLSSTLISSVFATHTLVSYPLVNSYGIAKNEAVAITVGGTILTDTAVLIILAILIGASQGALDQQFWTTMGVSISVFLLIMFGVIPRIAKWFFQKIEAEKTAHYIFVLFVVFFGAFLAELAGLEHIIGAFVAGLALNKLIPHSSALMNRIQFIGNSLFIPFFLISVGMIVDLSVLTKGPMALFVAAALTTAQLVGKWLASWLTQKSFGYSADQRQVIFGLSSGSAAATLAVIMVGYQYGMVDENVLNGMIVLILVTCVVSSIVTESASTKVVLAGEQDALPSKKDLAREERLMLPIANLKNMESLLDFATLIKSKKSTKPLTVVTVVPNNDMAEKNLKKARENLDSTARYASGSEIEVNMMATIDYNIASGISRATREVNADGVILGWPSKVGIIDKMVGEKTESILNRTDTNLFMCHIERPFVVDKRIVVFCLPFAEAEVGFKFWLQKVFRLASELTRDIHIVCVDRTEEAIKAFADEGKHAARLHFKHYYNWDDLSGLQKFTTESDVIIFVSARVGEVSYRHSLGSLPMKLGRVYGGYNRILVYPSRRSGLAMDDLEEVAAAPFLQRVGRGISHLLKRRADAP